MDSNFEYLDEDGMPCHHICDMAREKGTLERCMEECFEYYKKYGVDGPPLDGETEKTSDFGLKIGISIGVVVLLGIIVLIFILKFDGLKKIKSWAQRLCDKHPTPVTDEEQEEETEMFQTSQ